MLRDAISITSLSLAGCFIALGLLAQEHPVKKVLPPPQGTINTTYIDESFSVRSKTGDHAELQLGVTRGTVKRAIELSYNDKLVFYLEHGSPWFADGWNPARVEQCAVQVLDLSIEDNRRAQIAAAMRTKKQRAGEKRIGGIMLEERPIASTDLDACRMGKTHTAYGFYTVLNNGAESPTTVGNYYGFYVDTPLLVDGGNEGAAQ
jgi:hypothetical protein